MVCLLFHAVNTTIYFSPLWWGLLLPPRTLQPSSSSLHFVSPAFAIHRLTTFSFDLFRHFLTRLELDSVAFRHHYRFARPRIACFPWLPCHDFKDAEVAKLDAASSTRASMIPSKTRCTISFVAARGNPTSSAMFLASSLLVMRILFNPR